MTPPERKMRRIAIVGGGFSGLSSIRALKEEGMEPVCFERTPAPGGTWHYREDSPEGVPSIMPTTIINHSKEMGALSDSPPRPEYPNYMRHAELYRYFRDVGEASDCFRHMLFNREVVSVRRTPDHDRTGRWTVTVRNAETGEVTGDAFDGVMVCVGHITYPKIPHFPGIEKFRGRILHTHALKRVDAFAGQRVCVVGIGCSALDAAVEISNVARQVYLSTRSGSWIFPRVGPHGIPMDYALLRRYITLFQEFLPIAVSSKYIEWFFLDQKFNHDLYGLTPQYPVLCKDPSVNDLLPSRLLSGSVQLRKDVRHFTERGVLFEGEDSVTELDAVVMATGYRWKFPFLEEDVVTMEADGRVNLYKCVWPPHLEHPTLAVIGFVLPFGPGFPLGEVQCRWVAQVFAGNVRLPGREVMMADAVRRHEENVRRYRPGDDKMSIRVDFIPYMDEIASQFGAKPNLWKMLFTDPVLFRACAFGPSLPYQYRLQGPHRWAGARDAILRANERMKRPLQGEKSSQKRKGGRWHFVVRYLANLLLLSLWISWRDSTLKYYAAAMLLPHYMSWRSFLLKYLFAALLLPFFVSVDNFSTSYFITLLVPLLMAGLSSI